MPLRARHALTCAIVLLATTRATAEPARLNIKEPARVCTLAEPVRCRDVSPGVYLDLTTWDQSDAERRRLQDAEVRLTAENASLRSTAASWSPGWKSLASAVLVGVSLGVYAATR